MLVIGKSLIVPEQTNNIQQPRTQAQADRWSAKYRNWTYYPDWAVRSEHCTITLATSVTLPFCTILFLFPKLRRRHHALKVPPVCLDNATCCKQTVIWVLAVLLLQGSVHVQ